ncbi:MAG: V-type ATP synthase subunit K [Candidatus Nomurabacteria bacterium]|nr:MAG: V-type ATP synthase subunit K [Candidatus Nomurabacteria bacterium]
MGLAFAIAGAITAVSLAGIGSILGTATVGRAASGLVSVDPEKFGRVLLLQALPGTQGIYGFLGAIMALQKIGLLGGEVATISVNTGWEIFFACLPIAFTGLLSGLYQGRVAAAGVGIVAKKPSESGKGIIFAAVVETYAVLGLLATILLLNGITV